jgi:threonine dehydratase
MTGSFKARGALNKVLSLDFSKPVSIVTASTGNHAMATINAIRILFETSSDPEIESKVKA